MSLIEQDKESQNKPLSAVLRARELLRDVTPLNSDCGKLCGRACCDVDDPNAGMLLFPGEETLYTDWRLIRLEGFPNTPVPLLHCSGECDRNDRPLACRVAPLIPAIRRGKVSVEMDRRCGEMCPLVEHGITALRQDFVQAVRDAAQILADDPVCCDYVRRLTIHLDMAKRLLASIIAPERPAAAQGSRFQLNHADDISAEEQRDVQQ